MPSHKKGESHGNGNGWKPGQVKGANGNGKQVRVDDRSRSELCGAKKRNGEPCRHYAGFKTDHPGIGYCSLHGGKTRGHRVAAQKEIARREIKKLRLMVVGEGEEIPNLDPKMVLAEELYRTREAVRVLSARINQLGEIHGPLFHATGIPTGEHKPVAEWTMLQEQRQHLKQVADSCHKAGIDVFYAALERERVKAWLMVMDKVYTALALTEEQKRLANETAARELRLLEADPEAVKVIP